MSEGRRSIVWFNEVTKDDVALVGGKGANLGEMTRAEIPVPPGFIVTADAYFSFLAEYKLDDEIRNLLAPLDTGNTRQLYQVAELVKQRITSAAMPKKLTNQIKSAYVKLGKCPVAVRSSATAEDLPTASFAGQQSTFLNVQGEEAVVTAVQKCWASLFEPRAIFYRQQQGFDHFKVGIAVPVQKMVQSEASGVMFTIEPVTSDRSKIVIEAVLGLGEAIVGGEVNPDLYIVEKAGLKIATKQIGKQQWQLIKNPDGTSDRINIKVPLSVSSQNQQKISDDEIVSLARLAKRLEDHYKCPQDIEWAKQDKQILIVQTRPVTTIKETTEDTSEIAAPVILTGASASPGIASGPVKII